MPGSVPADSPSFALALTEIRGFDLGDDAELLETLQARREIPDALDGDDWLLLGVLRHRIADRAAPGSSDPDAATCFECAARLGHAEALAHFLRGHVLLRLGRLDEAQDAFERAIDAPEDHASCPPAELRHASGRVALARDDLEHALTCFRDGLDRDPSSATRWLDTARLLSMLGRDDEAREAIERALINDPGQVEALYEQAALAAARGDQSTAARALDQALTLDPSLRTRAAKDARLERFVTATTVAQGSTSAPRPNLDWLEALPDWVAGLRRDEVATSLGISWLDSADSEQIATRVAASHERSPPGVMYSDAMLERIRTLLRNKRPVAWGPPSNGREPLTERPLLWIDRNRPDQLWLGLSRHMPPQLWLPAGSSGDELRAALAPYVPTPQRRRRDMPRLARGFVGYRLRFGVPNPYTAEIQPANARELDRYFAVNPFVEAAYWGSAYDDDPWPTERPGQPDTLETDALQRRLAEQAPGQVWSISRRTRHSRSYLTIELHHRDIFVAEVRYEPASDARLVERLNADLGCDYPLDMPVDAVAALLGFQFEQADDLRTRLDSSADPEELAGIILVLSSLCHSDLSMTRVYRRYMDHPESVVRTTLCNIFVAHNHESLLEEMSITEPDDDVRAQVDAVLDEGIAIVQYDPYTDYDESDPETEGA
jgi:tetratricopeptide (TPR) repeat protein